MGGVQRPRGSHIEISRLAMRKKQLTLSLPESLFADMQEIANSEGITITQLMKKFIKLGLIATEASKDPDKAILIKDASGKKELKFFLIYKGHSAQIAALQSGGLFCISGNPVLVIRFCQDFGNQSRIVSWQRFVSFF